MTTPRVQQIPVVIDDSTTAARVRQAVNHMGTARATAYAMALGVRPPTDDPGWNLIPFLETPDSPGEMVWELVVDGLLEANLLYRRTDLYDALAGDDTAKAEQVLILTVRYGPADSNAILDLACGTGRDLDQMRSFKRRVGVDVQAELVEYGRRLRPGLDLRTADIRGVRLQEVFDVITCLGNSFSYLHSDEDQHAAWRTFTAHARTGTLLIIQTLLAPPVVSVSAQRVEAPGVSADTRVEVEWYPELRLSVMRRTWFLAEPQHDTIRRRVTSTAELRALAEAHGWWVPPGDLPSGYFVAVTDSDGGT